MKRILLIAALLGAVLVGVQPLSVTHANTVSDAAHACQQGGYASLQGSDGTKFQNAGQCTTFVARGGTIGGIPACIVSTTAPGTGCLTLDNSVAFLCPNGSCNSPSSTDFMTLSGVISFSPTSCGSLVSGCPPGTAVGSGSYSIAGINAQSGTFTVTAEVVSNFETGSTGVACAGAAYQLVDVSVVLTPTGGNPSTAQLEAIVQNGSSAELFVGDPGGSFYRGEPASGVTIQC